MKPMFSCRILLGFSLVLWSSWYTHADDQNNFRVCLLENNLPYSSRQENSGFDFDTAKAVADALGKKLLPVWTKNSTRISELEESDFPTRKLARNECDALFSLPGAEAIKDTPKLAIGAPYYGAAFELISKTSDAPKQLQTLGNNTVAIQSQTIANFVLHAHHTPIRTFFSTEDALNGVLKGEAALALLWGPAAGWHLHNHPELSLFFVSGYTPPAVVRWNEHVATQKGATDLQSSIDNTLKKLTEAGTLENLAKRYGIPFHKPFESTYSFAEMQKLN
jgi:ABC-type amino acid transport substrate-binding protein